MSILIVSPLRRRRQGSGIAESALFSGATTGKGVCGEPTIPLKSVLRFANAALVRLSASTSLSIPEERRPAFLKAVSGRTPAPRELLPPARMLLLRRGNDRVDLKVAELI